MIVIASTRPGRVGLPVARWFEARARAHGAFELDVVDLFELDLPFLDEPHHPKLAKYTKQHTKEWSQRVDAADAVVLVMPEYNHGYTAPLKNALDFLHREWQHKPVGFVSYGGVAAGTRAVQLLKPVLIALKTHPLMDVVSIPFVKERVGEDGEFRADEPLEGAARVMLDELVRFAGVLAPLRAES
jgi:NAD(P)H-dependent FMN reductase